MREKPVWTLKRVVMGVVVMVAVGTAGAQTLPTTRVRFPTTFPAAELPTLGVNAEGRWVGPDQRIWYFRQFRRPIVLAEVKQEIAEQFGRPEPTLTRCGVALFEPGGRVWFATAVVTGTNGPAAFQAMLLGYDGKNWIATRMGIHELVEAEAGSGRYALRETFRPALDVWMPESMRVLNDGRVALRGMKDRLGGQWRLYALGVLAR